MSSDDLGDGSGVTSGGVSGALVDGADVFISYGNADVALARELRGHLETGGYRCWMAPDDVAGAKSWVEQIVDAIAACRVVLVLISATSNASDHVSKEVDLALEHGKALLPVRIEDVVPSGALRYLLALAQWIDVFPGPLGPHADAVKRQVEAIVSSDARTASDVSTLPGRPAKPAAPLGPGELPAPMPPPEPVPSRYVPPDDRRSRRWPKWAVPMAAAVVLAGGIAAVLWFIGDGESYTYGDDPRLDWLWDRCAASEMEACDALLAESPSATDYSRYAETCGERVVSGGECVSRGIRDPFTYGEDPALDRLWDACSAGEMAACDSLAGEAAAETEYARYADTCGDRFDGGGGCATRSDGNEPFGYGDDPYLDRLWDGCSGEDFAACDTLYQEAPIGSDYEHHGGTCAGRTDFPAGCAPLVDGVAELDALADGCSAGDMEACWTLYLSAPAGSEYEAFGRTCGGRTDGSFACVYTYGDSPRLDEMWDVCAGGGMDACDLLFVESPGGSEYEAFGWTCGWRTDGGGQCA